MTVRQRMTVREPMTVRQGLKPVAIDRGPVGADSASGSIPHVSLVKREIVFPKEPAEFVLKTHGAVMFRLRGNVLLHGIDLRVADRECRVARLPGESAEVGKCIVDPT